MGKSASICRAFKRNVLVPSPARAQRSMVADLLRLAWPKGGSFIVALLLAIGMTIMFASRVDRVAAYLLIPYLAWVAYATTINAGVVALN
jgi:TspO/MBR family